MKNTLEYDLWGNVTRVLNDRGVLLASNTYNALGLLERSTDATGRDTHYGYDALGNLTDSWYVAQETTGGQTRDVTFKTHKVYDAEGRVTNSYQIVRQDAGPEKYTSSTQTVYNDAGQVYRTSGRTYGADGATVESELVSESGYDARGLVVETRSQGLATGTSTPVWFISRTVYDAQGRVVYATDRFAEGTPAAEITGTYTVYNADGRVTSTSRLVGLAIGVTATLSGVDDARQIYASSVDSPGTTLSTTSTSYEDGRVSETVDQYGRATQYTYNQYGETIQVRRQSGDASGNLVWLVSRTVYDKLGRAAYVTDECPEGWHAQSGAMGVVYGTRTLYDAQGRVVETRRLKGLVIELSGNSTRVVKDGTTLWRTTTKYDSEGRVVESKAADGQITNYEYDSLGRRTAVIGQAVKASSVGLLLPGDPLVRHRAETVYDSAGRVYREITNIRQYSPTDFDRSAQQVTTYEYDAVGNVVKTTRSAAGSTLEVVTQSEYDSAGRKTAQIDPLGNRTEYRQDSQGRLYQVILPAVPDPEAGGQLTHPVYEYHYDASGNQTEIIDPKLHTTQFTFDSAGRQLGRTLPLGVETPEVGDFTETFDYDVQGRQTLHVSFEGVVKQSVYDDSAAGGGRLAQERFFPSLAAYDNGAGTPSEVWVYGVDAFGRQVQVVQDREGNLDITADQRVMTNAYDAEGHLTSQSSPEGTIFYEYDSLGRKIRTYTGSVAQVENDWRYSYDALGRLFEVSALVLNGQATDIDSQLEEQYRTPGNQPEATTYHYDLVGNLDWERHSNWLVTDYEYDALNRLEKVIQRVGWFEDLPLGSTPFAEYDYDLLPDGRRAGVTEKDRVGSVARTTARIDWFYDQLGRLTREVYDSQTDDTLDFATDYLFDLAGNRLEKTTDHTPTSESWGGYRNGAALAVDEAIRYLYDSNDRLLEEDADLNADVDAQHVIDRTTLYNYSVTQQTGKEVRNAGVLASQTTMSYDLQGRLETATIETFQTDGTTVDRRETTSYDYDHTGIRVSARNTVEMWTTDWLTQVTQFGQVRDYTTAYLVDHDNFTGYEQVLLEETRPTSGGYAVRRVTYTLGHDVIGQWSEGIIPPPGQGEYSFGMNVPTGSHLLVADAHGSTRVLAPADIPGNGQVVLQQYSYDAYGLPLGFNPAESATTLLYSGEQYDQRDDLYYFRGRDYRAGTGTFTTLDPYFGNLYDPQTLHKTLYVNADPINGIDPTGKMGLTSLMVGLGIATNIRSLKNESDMLTFDIASTMFIGVQAGMSVEATFWMFAEGQLSGFLIGFALGKAVTKLSDIWENGVTILSPRRGASSVGSRPFAVLHNTDFRFPRSKNAIAPKSGLGVLPIDEARIGVFNSVQQPRVREWAGWTRSTDGVKDVRLRQEQHNVLGMHISKNEPDLQLTLQGGRTYKLPGGAEIEIPFGQDRRVYIEFDPYKGSRGNAHLKNLLGDDAQSLVVLDTFDKNGLVSSVTFNNM